MTSSAGNILVIDDTVQNLKLLVDLLKVRGYTVRPATDGELGLQAARQEPPDIILLDVKLPDIDGYEVCRYLKADEQLADIPVLFISVNDKVFDKVRAFEVGAVDYVTKPFEIAELIARIETQLRLRRQQQKIESISRQIQLLAELQRDFFNAAIHDLQSPISMILGMTDRLNDSLTNDKQPYLENIEQAVTFMRDLVDKMLNLAHLDADATLNLDDMLLSRLMEKIYNQHFSDVNHITTQLHLPAEDAIIRVDPIWFERIVSNVLSNAVKFTSEGQIEVAANITEDSLVITVSDTGIGISPDVIDRVFDPFYRNHLQFHGTGLGLTIVKLAVEAHGGWVKLDSQMDVGTIVTLYFPQD